MGTIYPEKQRHIEYKWQLLAYNMLEVEHNLTSTSEL
jgi:hypothetical protein